ncbi:MAG: hypothetical protein JSR74_12535 [Proteobacteria bacterium]|nr:hypothetical protein [Pseudomonadota bacterium]
MRTAITFEIDTDGLDSKTEAYLAQLWHIAQANPAPLGDRDAGDLVAHVSTEIIRRWLSGVRPDLYSHQSRDHYWKVLTSLGARFIDGAWRMPTDTDADAEARP